MRRLAKCCALVSPGPHALFLILSCDDAKNERFDMKQIVTTVFGTIHIIFLTYLYYSFNLSKETSDKRN